MQIRCNAKLALIFLMCSSLWACGGDEDSDDSSDNEDLAVIEGVWSAIEISDETDCGDGVVEYAYTNTISATGNILQVIYDEDPSRSYSGSVSHSSAEWGGTFALEGDSNTFSAEVTPVGSTAVGTIDWQVSGSENCTGTSTLTMACLSGACLNAQDLSTTTNVAGTWEFVEISDETDCGDGSVQYDYDISLSQNDTMISIAYEEGGTSSGTINGNQVEWSGLFPEDGGTSVFTMMLNVSGSSATGTAQWSWRDDIDSCEGTSQITATCVSGACLN